MANRKLIEVALPLDAINAACKSDKARTTGSLRNLHKWFAPMPLPAWRALLFATLVDDPGDTESRDRLMRLIEDLVASGGDLPAPDVVARAIAEIETSWPDGPPTVLDPFCGGGSTLIEAQRLGCETIGSDLNPVPVLITSFLTSMLPRVGGRAPLHRAYGQLPLDGGPFEGFAADVLHYSELILKRVQDQVGDAYRSTAPGEKVVAWLWARTVKCPNPACGATAPLIDSLWLSKKRGQERHLSMAFRADGTPVFEVCDGAPAASGTVERAGASCARCASPIPFAYIRTEGQAGRLGVVMTSVAVERDGHREYRRPSDGDVARSSSPVPSTKPELAINPRGQGMRTPLYGLSSWADLYTNRQLFVLEALSDAVAETHINRLFATAATMIGRRP